MEILRMSAAVPFLVGLWNREVSMSLRKVLSPNKKIFGAGLCSLCFLGPAHAAVTVYPPAALQADFVAATTNQWNATVKPSVIPGNVSITLTSKKTTVPKIPTCELYAYGFANGQSYERSVDLETMRSYMSHCDHPLLFGLPDTTPWDSETCVPSILAVYNEVYQQNFSTPTVTTEP